MSFGHERLDVYRAANEYAAGGIDADTDSDPEGSQCNGKMPNHTLHWTRWKDARQ